MDITPEILAEIRAVSEDNRRRYLEEQAEALSAARKAEAEAVEALIACMEEYGKGWFDDQALVKWCKKRRDVLHGLYAARAEVQRLGGET